VGAGPSGPKGRWYGAGMSVRHAIATLAAGLALGLAGCGADDENPAASGPTVPPLATTSTAAPTETAPPAPTSAPAPPPTTPARPAPSGGSGGTPAPGGSSGGSASPDDAGDRFEEYCRTHPGACGD